MNKQILLLFLSASLFWVYPSFAYDTYTCTCVTPNSTCPAGIIDKQTNETLNTKQCCGSNPAGCAWAPQGRGVKGVTFTSSCGLSQYKANGFTCV